MPQYGFTFDWMQHQRADRSLRPAPVDLRALDFMAKHGFNFARLPLSYWFFSDNFDYTSFREEPFQFIDQYLAACRQRGIQLCLSLYRAPGHCIDSPQREIHVLWSEELAQAGLVWLWESIAGRYQSIAPAELCYEILSDAPPVGVNEMNRDNYLHVVQIAVQAIRAIDPDRELMVSGLNYGGEVVQELESLNITQCLHGEFPVNLTQLGSSRWLCDEHEDQFDYPRKRDSQEVWDKPAMVRYLAPWRNWQTLGNRVFVSSFGFGNAMDNWIAIAWFRDFLSLCKHYGWGYCLGAFKGRFGLVGHGRIQTYFKEIDGYQVDRSLLELLCLNRVTPSDSIA